MKTYHITSSKWGGFVKLVYDRTGVLCYLDLLQAEMDTEQKVSFLFALSHELVDLPKLVEISKAITITEVHEVPTFEQFWELYNYKVSKHKVTKLWEKLTDSDKLEAVMSIKPYDKYVESRGIAKKYPDTYIRNRDFETDWRSLIKR